MVQLPLELILHIVDAIADFGYEPSVALDSSDWRTIQLRQWQLVCKRTGHIATRHLYGHCMYINSNRKLMHLIRTFNPPSCASDVERASAGRLIPYVSSLYLAPFTRFLDDLPTATWIFELLCLVAPRLKRFHFHFPFDTLSSHLDHLGVYRWLRDGLIRLTNLEELVSLSVDNNLIIGWSFGQEHRGLWWSGFHNLQRLVLPWPNVPDYLCDLQRFPQKLPSLTHLVLHLRTTPNADDRQPALEKLSGEHSHEVLKVIHVYHNLPPYRRGPHIGYLSAMDSGRVELHSICITGPPSPNAPRHGPDSKVGSFIRNEALSGKLWCAPTIKHTYECPNESSSE